MLLQAYRRYRVWAAGFDKGASRRLGACAGVGGVVLLAVMGSDWTLWRFLPWFAAICGPLASFDAYGAAAHRGAPREGVARAVLILALCWGFSAYAFFERAPSP